MKEFAIEVESLTKKFGDFLAVDNISFNVEKGEIFGFLGPNGAGKSTLIRMLCGLLEPSNGTAKVGGFDIRKTHEKVKKNIGYMTQKFSLYNDLTVEENINFFGGIYGLSKEEINEKINWTLQMSDLEGKEKALTGKLSSAWKQRLALGCAILHNPKIVFLDEPTSGVDPISRRNFWELIYELSDKKITIFVTTHFLEEAEYCNRLGLIYNGKLIAIGTPRELKEKSSYEGLIPSPTLEDAFVYLMEKEREEFKHNPLKSKG
ncbi:MAG: ABC transporter ATP-binding protein [Acidobacteriota bacterium]